MMEKGLEWLFQPFQTRVTNWERENAYLRSIPSHIRSGVCYEDRHELCHLCCCFCHALCGQAIAMLIENNPAYKTHCLRDVEAVASDHYEPSGTRYKIARCKLRS